MRAHERTLPPRRAERGHAGRATHGSCLIHGGSRRLGHFVLAAGAMIGMSTAAPAAGAREGTPIGPNMGANASTPALEAAGPLPAGASWTRSTVVLDAVDLDIRTPFLPSTDFSAASPGDATQVAVSVSWEPFRELTVTAIPYGSTAGTEQLPMAEAGIAPAYRQALADYRVNQGGDLGPGPMARLFGRTVAGQASLVPLHVNRDALDPTLIVTWVVEAGERVWLVRASQAVPPAISSLSAAAPFLARIEGLTIASDTLDRPTTVFDGPAHGPGTLDPGSPPVDERSAAETLPYPSWWDGYCDTNYYYYYSGIYAYPLGGTYLGMPACGPRPAYGEGPDVAVYFFPGAWGEYEWECVELSMRYLYLAYGIEPYSANGSQVVWNYSGTTLTKVSNGTAGSAPVPGDVLSYGSTSTWGHTSVVTASSVDSNGNGTITVLEQNASANGVATLSVSGWYVSNSVSGWLHKPGSGTPSTPTCITSPSDRTCDGRDPSATGCANDAYTVETATIVNSVGQTLGWVDLRYSNQCQSNWSRVRSNVGAATLFAKAVREDGLTLREIGSDSTVWTNMIYAPSKQVKACGAVGTALSCTTAY